MACAIAGADLKTSLTYLRGLGIQQLEVIHMPELV